jgi:DNA-binding MarR family transcriptional regulator
MPATRHRPQLRLAPDQSERRPYFSVESLQAALKQQQWSSRQEDEEDQPVLTRAEKISRLPCIRALADAIKVAEGQGPDVATEEWNGQFDLLELKPAPVPSRLPHLHIQPDPVEAEPEERPQRAGELPPGVHTGRAGAEHVQRHRAERNAKVAEPEPPPPQVVEEDSPAPAEEGEPAAKPYFLKIPSELLERTDLSPGAKILLTWLTNGSRMKGCKPVAPSQSFIAEKLGTNRHRISGFTTELENAGLITFERRHARNAARYTVLGLMPKGGS